MATEGQDKNGCMIPEGLPPLHLPPPPISPRQSEATTAVVSSLAKLGFITRKSPRGIRRRRRRRRRGSFSCLY